MDAVGEYGGLRLDESRSVDSIRDGYTYFRNGDVVVAKITPCFENGKGAVAQGLLNGVGFGTTELHVLRPKANLDARFLFYVTLSDRFRKTGEAEMYGAGGQKRVPEDFIRDFRHPIPPLPHQKARLLVLLDEKRIALITRAVTKGLDPMVPMKESGVEWLGRVPAHWQVKRLKFVVPQLTVGIVVTPAKYYVDEGVLCLRSLNISSGTIDLSDVVSISPESNELHAKSKIREGDIVVVRTGLAGTAVVVPRELDGANCIDLLIIRRSAEMVSEFVRYFLASTAAAVQVEAYTEGAIQGHYNTSTLADLLITAPPVPEQQRIVRRVQEESDRVTALRDSVTKALSLLREYRTALISAAVTGQIDVSRR